MRTTTIEPLEQIDEKDEGFTLIELLIVVMIIGILLGIAIPVYLSATAGAKTNSAAANLETALTGAKTVYTDNGGSYPTMSASPSFLQGMQGAGTGLTYVNGTTSGGGVSNNESTIAVDSPTTAVAVLANGDGSSNCYAVADVESNGGAGSVNSAFTAAGTYWLKFGDGTGCTAAAAEAATGWTTTPPSSATANG